MLGGLFTDVRHFASIDSTNRYLLDEARARCAGGCRRGRRPPERRPWPARPPVGGTARVEPARVRAPPARAPRGDRATWRAAVVALARTDRVAGGDRRRARRQVAERLGGRRRPEGRGHPRRGRPGRAIGRSRSPSRDRDRTPCDRGRDRGQRELAGERRRPPGRTGRHRHARSGELAGADVEVDRDALLSALLDTLEPRVRDLGDRAGRLRQAREFETACATIGRAVRVELAGETYAGTALRLTPEGHLVVGTPGGERRVVAGDVVHLRPADGGGRTPTDRHPRARANICRSCTSSSPAAPVSSVRTSSATGSQRHPDDEVVAFDVLTYAGNRPNLADVEDRIDLRARRHRRLRDSSPRRSPSTTPT